MRWWRLLIAGIVAESVLLVIVDAFVWPIFGDQAANVTVLVVGPALMCVAAMWVGRKTESHLILHGALVGVVATTFYTALFVGDTRQAWIQRDVLFFVFHVVKIAGGAIGGLFASQRLRQMRVSGLSKA